MTGFLMELVPGLDSSSVSKEKQNHSQTDRTEKRQTERLRYWQTNRHEEKQGHLSERKTIPLKKTEGERVRIWRTDIKKNKYHC